MDFFYEDSLHDLAESDHSYEHELAAWVAAQADGLPMADQESLVLSLTDYPIGPGDSGSTVSHSDHWPTTRETYAALNHGSSGSTPQHLDHLYCHEEMDPIDDDSWPIIIDISDDEDAL